MAFVPPLKVLLLEDDADDAAFIERELRRAGLEHSLRRVVLKAAFVETLASYAPDIVLADSRLPNLDARAAIELVNAHDPTLPVIVVTGALGDEAAVALLHAGASDCVLKDRLARLGPAVRRALEERTEKLSRAAAEAALHASEVRFRRLFETALDGILIVNADSGLILEANPAVLTLVGSSPDALVGAPLWEVDALRGIFGPEAVFREMAAKGRFQFTDGVLRRRGRQPLEVEVAGSAFQTGSARIFQCNVRDVSERRRLQRALLAATDHEQRHLAQELHDGLGQDLAGLGMLMHGAMNEAKAGRLVSVEEIERMSLVVRNALRACHDIAHGLSPLTGMPGGLVEALNALKLRLGGPPGPSLELEVAECTMALPSESCDHLYRIAQEAATNAMKHARAKRVTIRLRADDRGLRLEVADDGCGVKGGRVGRTGLGLHTMHDRAASIGGTLQLLPNPGGGTNVVCQVPQAPGVRWKF
ncbi:MAG TPA: ATP-binding protein [Steroidobacteraceae bacterium]